ARWCRCRPEARRRLAGGPRHRRDPKPPERSGAASPGHMMARPNRLRPPPHFSIGLGIIAAAALTLLAMGQPPICRCGTVKVWQGDVMGPENSQQLADWYSPSHLIHGLLFYG